MFRTQLGPVDVLNQISKFMEENNDVDRKNIREGIDNIVKESAVYLRPETAQAMFVQFLNCQQSMSMKVPFGIAQMGKSFRNEITTEHFIFRSCEFEQMEMEFFVEPGTQREWLDYWRDKRLEWWKAYANHPEKFIYRAHEIDELLWAFDPQSFVPHNLVGEGIKQGSAIEIGHLAPQNRRPVHINLSKHVPNFVNQYQQIIDFVPTDESLKQAARERFKQYRAQGFALNTHKVVAEQPVTQ